MHEQKLFPQNFTWSTGDADALNVEFIVKARNKQGGITGSKRCSKLSQRWQIKTIFCFFLVGTADKTSILVLLWDSIQEDHDLVLLFFMEAWCRIHCGKIRWTSLRASFKDKSLSKAPLDKGPCNLKHKEQDTAVNLEASGEEMYNPGDMDYRSIWLQGFSVHIRQ